MTECVEFRNKITFHSNLVVSGVFINKGTCLSAFILVHHLHADIILHHTSAWGLACPLLIHLLSLCSSGHSALCSLSRGSNQLGCSSILAPGSFHTSHKMMRNCGAEPLILSPTVRVPRQAPAFHVAPQTPEASVPLEY